LKSFSDLNQMRRGEEASGEAAASEDGFCEGAGGPFAFSARYVNDGERGEIEMQSMEIMMHLSCHQMASEDGLLESFDCLGLQGEEG